MSVLLGAIQQGLERSRLVHFPSLCDWGYTNIAAYQKRTSMPLLQPCPLSMVLEQVSQGTSSASRHLVWSLESS